ncbi:unnamed protein product [Symbiodinium natans]|uniref:TM7S3/TM198-like domain-containing protein n=1 Tax=Symbiodinium natans TaxID=878477 RepID=A0A812J9E7_9DINO|nr:unnamed protein product [Symbiodinium natans]
MVTFALELGQGQHVLSSLVSLTPSARAKSTAFELERTQVEQIEDQLRDKQGVAKKPGSGGGPFGGLAGAVGGLVLGSKGSKHAGDGRIGAGKKSQQGMLNDALGGMGVAGTLASGALNTFGPSLLGKAKGPEIAEERTESGTENAEVKAQMTGEGEDVAPVSEVAEQKEVDEAEDQEGEGPPPGDIEEKMGKAPDISVADLYKYYTNRLARRARQAAMIADQAVQEAWKQQQLARYWNRQALEAEAAARKALPPKVDDERSTWQLKVPPGWEVPPSPIVSAHDPRSVTIYSGTMSSGLVMAGTVASIWESNLKSHMLRIHTPCMSWIGSGHFRNIHATVRSSGQMPIQKRISCDLFSYNNLRIDAAMDAVHSMPAKSGGNQTGLPEMSFNEAVHEVFLPLEGEVCDASATVFLSILCAIGLAVSLFGYRIYKVAFPFFAFLVGFGLEALIGSHWVNLVPDEATTVKKVIVLVCCVLWGTLAAVLAQRCRQSIEKVLGIVFGVFLGLAVTGILVYALQRPLSNSFGPAYKGWDQFGGVTLGVPLAMLAGYLCRSWVKHLIMFITAFFGAWVAWLCATNLLKCAEVESELLNRHIINVVIVIGLGFLGLIAQILWQPRGERKMREVAGAGEV